MSRHDTTLAHAARIERTLRFMADHLDDALDVDTLAGVAAFSPFHFHRIFAGVTGETVGDAIRRLRLHRASVDLGHGGMPLARVAKRAGYGSVAAFTRAFAAAYGQPPAAFRERGQALRSGLQPDGAPMTTETLPLPLRLPIRYDVTIERTDAFTLAALPHVGDYNRIGDTFARLGPIAGARGLLGPATRMIGVYHDDPASVPVKALRSHAGFTVSPTATIGDDLERITVPGGDVAVLTHKGPYTDLDVAYAYLFRVWLPSSGREPADFPCYEDYLNDPRQVPPTQWLTKVHLPLKTQG